MCKLALTLGFCIYFISLSIWVKTKRTCFRPWLARPSVHCGLRNWRNLLSRNYNLPLSSLTFFIGLFPIVLLSILFDQFDKVLVKMALVRSDQWTVVSLDRPRSHNLLLKIHLHAIQSLLLIVCLLLAIP